MFKLAFVGMVCVLATTSAGAQDPQSILNALIQRQVQHDELRRQNDDMRLEIERRDLEQELRFRQETDSQIANELARYCPAAGAPCLQRPPDALLREGARRGLVEYGTDPQSRARRGFDCVSIGDDEGGGFTDCSGLY